MHDAEQVIADPVVRNRGTIGGSLCQADPAEDLTTVCDVLRAEACHPRARRRAHRLAWREFHRGPYETACGQDEMLTEIRFPIRAGSGSAYEKVERRVGDWAVGAAGAAVSLADDGTIADAAIGLTALGLDGRLRRAPRPCCAGSGPARTCSPRPAGWPPRPASRSRTSAARSTTSGTSPTNSPAGSCAAPAAPRRTEAQEG